MKVMLGDTVVLTKEAGGRIGIVTQRSGLTLTIRRPDQDNALERVSRCDVEPLASWMADARRRQTKFSNSLSLTGQSPLSALVTSFGYSADVKMKRNSLANVVRQLERAGLEITSTTGSWDRDAPFVLSLKDKGEERPGTVESEPEEGLLAEVPLPQPFWPSSLGLPAERELSFLRALTGREPILALLYLPENAETQSWLQPTWEGLMSWAFRAAQRFVRTASSEYSAPKVVRGPAALLHGYLKPTALSSEGLRLEDSSRCLNLIALRQEAESPVDFAHLMAAWPGPVFEFDGTAVTQGGAPVAKLLLAVGGKPERATDQVVSELSPLKLLLWSREASAQVLAQATAQLGEVLANSKVPKLKGSNENATALALKAHLAQWVKRRHPKASFQFEHHQVEDFDEDHTAREVSRIDLTVEGQGLFEVETLSGSGPIEAFYHQKIFSRRKRGEPFSLVVPSEALLWAGPFLADIAHHLGSDGQVLLPAAGNALSCLQPHALSRLVSEVKEPEEEARTASPLERVEKKAEQPVRMRDIAGYKPVKELIERSILWPERHLHLTRGISRTSGILFFGPPGCGKSRLARAIAGELEQEVRLLSPADLRGPFIGWGQVMIREQFAWVTEREKRMLIIDELDASARSRRTGHMHSDEKADVNELLVQLDKAGRLGRLIVGTTNYIGSLDEAVIRSGRFGLYVPVPPPDLDEAVTIIFYYLERIARPEVPGALQLAAPSRDTLLDVLKPLFVANCVEQRFFCGADLEAAVNEAFIRCLRREFPAGISLQHHGTVKLSLSASELSSCLDAGPRSVSAKAVRRFLLETHRHCGPGVARALEPRFDANPRNT